jgi:hypothetical protein
MNDGDGWVNDKTVPLLCGAPPQVRERDHDDSHETNIDETSEESKSAQCPKWVKDGCGRQADGTAGLPPAPEILVRPGTYASCQRTKSLRSSPLRGGRSRGTGSQLRGKRWQV